MSDNGHTLAWPPGESLGREYSAPHDPVQSKVELGTPAAQYAHKQAMLAQQQIERRTRQRRA